MATCPLCGGTKFGDYRGRHEARCATCGSKERARIMAIVIRKLLPNSTELPVLHFAPEKAIADLLIDKFGSNYAPADYSPESYAWSKVPVQKVDLSRPRDYLHPSSNRGLIHSHVLEHIPGALDRIIEEMNESLVQGGFHLFQVPIIKGWYREDMDPDMSAEKRTDAFFQFDHLRIFGDKDFEDRVLRLFKGFTRIDIGSQISSVDLENAQVPISTLSRFNGHTPFLFIKN